MTTRKFAQDTSVPVERSRSEIEKRLQEAGAAGFGFMRLGNVGAKDSREVVTFQIANRTVRIEVGVSADAQEQRRRWRCVLLLVKAKLTAVADGISTVEREFLADIVLPNGQTVGTWLQPQIAQQKMPLMLGPGGGR